MHQHVSMPFSYTMVWVKLGNVFKVIKMSPDYISQTIKGKKQAEKLSAPAPLTQPRNHFSDGP